ncbi:ATP-grasp domain-containing protein [Desulfosporosinus sp.]|uniref:ATP-grasp domain-containing protein n=1 Tax=Desulfosporosinus sp. TaxID=157907 RepID=UPI0025BB19DF|nr:ATP-grasp domain-containing protein [Desulfosporosinus sp.]MBC2724764.1 ATP-grasp domain-containing protein [Desulfosporosinus sp.]MBC2725114.1 ATP-grasp domain-containing protein [Desulfosporosinus sp.]
MSSGIQTIYFNRCFSSTPKIIQRFLTSNPSNFKIYISHVCPNNDLQEVADYFEVEPSVNGRDYVDYCLDFCFKHGVNLFVPRYNVTTLIEYKEQFDRLGVKVMFVGDSETYQLLDNKLKTYEALEGANLVAIPKAFRIENIKDFENAYNLITRIGSSVCLKPISGIGGDGFKRILDDMTEIDELNKTTNSTISLARINRILEHSNIVEPFMVMEYLEGDEYSIDCLGNNGELVVAVPRKKADLYRQTIEYREDLIAIAQRLTKEFSLSYLYNIQVKYHKGVAHLIEINTRMSAGIHKSCFTGVNFLDLAIKQLMGESIKTPDTIDWSLQIRTIENYELTHINM